MELYETNLAAVRTVWSDRKAKQSFQMLIYKAIANTTDLPAKEVEEVLAEIGRLVEQEEESTTRPDPAM